MVCRAAVATFVLLWDVYKWIRSDPNLNIKAKPNITCIDIADIEEKSIFIEVTNAGNATTTLTHLTFKRYKNQFDGILEKNVISQGGLMDNSLGPNLPYALEAGGRWTGGLSQEDLLIETGNEGIVV